MQYPYLYKAIVGLIANYSFFFEFFPIVMNI